MRAVTNFDIADKTAQSVRWQGEYCLLLVDEEGVITKLVNRPFTLAGGEEYYSQLSAPFPAAPEDGVYGIMLLVPGRGSVTAQFGSARAASRRFLGRSVEMQLATSLSVDTGSSYTSSVALFDS